MLDPSEMPGEEILTWAEGILGKVAVVSKFAHDHGYSQLWRLSTGAGFVWLKMHAHPHKWAGEVHALTKWAPQVGMAPRVLGYRTGPEAVLLSEVDGEDAETLPISGEQEERLWREAGAWLARLHARENDWLGNVTLDGAPHGAPATDAEAFVRGNWESTFAKGLASGLFSPAEIDFAGGAVRDGLPSLAGERPRAIHRDFTPRNWMAQRDGSLAAVIDFEHARWDVCAADLNRPWDNEFLRDPRLAGAFYDGYGGLSDRLRAQLQTLCTILAFNGVVWATGVGDGAYAARNRAALDRLREGHKLSSRFASG